MSKPSTIAGKPANHNKKTEKTGVKENPLGTERIVVTSLIKAISELREKINGFSSGMDREKQDSKIRDSPSSLQPEFQEILFIKLFKEIMKSVENCMKQFKVELIRQMKADFQRELEKTKEQIISQQQNCSHIAEHGLSTLSHDPKNDFDEENNLEKSSKREWVFPIRPFDLLSEEEQQMPLSPQQKGESIFLKESGGRRKETSEILQKNKKKINSSGGKYLFDHSQSKQQIARIS